MKNRHLLRALASVCSAGFLALSWDIAPRASTVFIDLDGNGTNESSASSSAVDNSPVTFSSRVTNKAVESAFAFDWKSAGPGGWAGALPAGTPAGVGLKWVWQTTSKVSQFTGSTCDDDVCFFAPEDPGTEPLGGPFFAPGRTTSPGTVSLSAETLTSSLLRAFSPFVELANAASSVEQLTSGEFRYQTLITNLTNSDIEFQTRPLPLVYSDALRSAQGPEWDTLSIPLDVPAGQTSVTVQVLSRDDLASGDRPASLVWVGAVLALSPPPAASAPAPALPVAGSETLGPASVPIALGTGVAAGGVGLASAQPAPLSVTVPAGATVKQVLLFWEGQSVAPAPGDNTIVVNGNLVTGTRIGGPTVFFQQGSPGGAGVQVSSFRADISSLGLVQSGTNTLTVGGLDFGYSNDGAGILVIHDDGTAKADIQVREGLDLAWFQFAPPLDTTVPQTFTFAPSPDDRTATLVLFVGSVQGPISGNGPHRPNSIEITSPPSPPRVIAPGGTFVECTTSRQPAKEIDNRLDLCGDGIPGPSGSCLGGIHPAAHGTFNRLRPDPGKTVGNAFLTPFNVTVHDLSPGGNGDGQLEPGETAEVIIEILNAGPVRVLTEGSADAILTSPPADLTLDGTFNPIPVGLSVDSSPYPDFVGLVPTEPPGAPCLLATPAPLAPSANVLPFVITIPQNHPRDVSRPFFLTVTGRLPDTTPVTMTVPLNIGIGSGCDPAAVAGTCDDGNPGTVDACVVCTDDCNALRGECVSTRPGSAPCLGTIGDFVWDDTNQDGVQDPDEPGIPNVQVFLEQPQQPAALGRFTPGALSSRAGEGYKFGSIFPLSEAGTATSFSFYSAGGGAAQKFTPVIYTADALGHPLSLVAKGAEVTVGAAQPAGWVRSALPPVPLTPGNYLLGLLSGPASVGALNFHDVVSNAGVYNANSYPAASSSWGASSHEDRRWSFFVELAADSGGNTAAAAITDEFGYYYLTDLCAGTYSVVVDESTLPSGFLASPCDAVSDDALDNDCSPVDVNLRSDRATDLTVDFGYYAPDESCTGEIGDFVWNDLNSDGIQNEEEPGLGGVEVTLESQGDETISVITTVTDSSGNYGFTELCAGTYTIAVVPTTLPQGFEPSSCNVGDDDALDNDCSPATVLLGDSESADTTIDFGYSLSSGSPLESEACSQGYWKNHLGSWGLTGYSPAQTVGTVFSAATTAFPDLGSQTPKKALSFRGGSSAKGAARILLRAGVAALLNASHPGIHYPIPPESVIDSVNAALASRDRRTMLSLASQLNDNARSCPL